MDSLITWYLVGFMSWLFMLEEFKCMRFVHVCAGAIFGITGLFAPIIFLMMEKEGLFKDPPTDPPSQK